MTEKKQRVKCPGCVQRLVTYTQFCPVCFRKLDPETQEVLRTYNNGRGSKVSKHMFRLAMKAAQCQLKETG